MSDDLGEREGGRVGVEFALDDLEVRRYGAQVVVSGLVCEIPQAQGLADFSGSKKLFEPRGNVDCAVWDVEVSDYED